MEPSRKMLIFGLILCQGNAPKNNPSHNNPICGALGPVHELSSLPLPAYPGLFVRGCLFELTNSLLPFGHRNVHPHLESSHPFSTGNQY